MPKTTYVNKLTIRPNEIKPGMGMAIKIVARTYDVIGGCWCAYLGPSDWDNEEVAESGDQIPEDAARLLFPVFNSTEMVYYNP